MSKKSNGLGKEIPQKICTNQNFDVPLQQKIHYIMGLLDNYTGIGMSPRPKWTHQNVIRHAMHRAYDELEEQGLVMLSEATVTDDWDDLAPDLIIFNPYNEPLSVIEITTHKECRQIIRKCHKLIVRFSQTEYFVYDYEQDMLYAYDAERNEWFSSAHFEIHSGYLSHPLLFYLH